MRIIFDLRNVGLGNNGGSSTLVKSGNTLKKLGHDVFFIDSIRNQHTWTKLNTKHLVVRKENNIPDADIIIATGYRSVGPTIKAPKRCGLKFHWIRAWEHWQMSDSRIVEHVLEVPTFKIVNSICLYDKLKSYGVKSTIIRPGYDFDQLFPMNIREKNKNVIIGGLYRAGVHGKRKRTSWLLQTASKLKSKYKNLKFWLFGSEKRPGGILCDNYLRGPNMKEKNKFYNNIDIWMAPTMSEGLHLPPAEAMITECPVVSTDAELSGTQDYVVNNSTGLISKNNFDSFLSCVDGLIEDDENRYRMGKNARKKIIELGDREQNMNKMIALFEATLETKK